MQNNLEFKQCLFNHQFTWLVTGVAGFIGSNLMEELLRLNQKIVGLDNFYSGYQTNIDKVLQEVPEQYRSNFSFHRGDICSLDDCLHVMQDVDYVLHHAAVCSVLDSIKNPLLTNEVNVGGFINILMAAQKHKVKRVIYASSSAVYGDSPISPKQEDQEVKPISPYAASKYINEIYAKTFSSCYGLEAIGLRYFNIFGKRQDPNGAYAAVIPVWLNAMLKGEKVFINGDGETTRDFCYIENVVQANLLAALTDNIAAINTVYNIASGRSITLNKLFDIMKSTFNITQISQPEYRNFRAGDIKQSVANIDKAATILRYQPSYQLEDGLLFMFGGQT